MKPHPDCILRITLIGSDNGGRRVPIPAMWFGITLQANAKNFDVRVRLETPLAAGETREIGADFLNPVGAGELLAVGDKFDLWELGVIGFGTILQTEVVPQRA